MEPTAATRTISHYRLDSVLGKGGMGVVHLAHDTRLCRPVAVKVLSGNRLDARPRDRLREEALLLSRLSHPNIATVFDFGTEGDVDYLVMEFVPGQTLDRMLGRAPFPAPRVAALGSQLARGLAAAHSAGVIHRDIKPGNVRVTPDGLLKILDFGVAISPSASFSSQTTGDAVRVLPAMAGTLEYMAPEHLRGGAADERTDIFSVGVVLFQMACGRAPYTGEHPIRLMESILRGAAPRPRSVNPEVDPAIERVILRAMQVDPRRRYARAADLAADLELAAQRAEHETRWHHAVRMAGKWLGRLSAARLHVEAPNRMIW